MAQKIKFVTDSASDIPRSLREELDILVLPHRHGSPGVSGRR